MSIDDQIRILERFNEKVDRLRQGGFTEESAGGGAILEWRKGEGWNSIHVGAASKTVEATVLTLRFFVVSNEDTSLRKMAELYPKLNIEPRLSTRFCKIRDQVNSYLDAPSNLSISEEGPMTHGDIFDVFINGDLAHANNAEAEATYRSLRVTPLFPAFQADFTQTIQLFMSALNEMQRINCEALDQLRCGRS